MIRGLQRLGADGRYAKGEVAPDRQRECKASPLNGALACVEVCVDTNGHVWHRHPSADAVTCHKCDLTYLGGPTHVVKSEVMS